MNTALRLAVVAFVASWVPPALLSAYAAAVTGGHPNGLFIFAGAAWLVELAHILVIGVPLFIYLMRRDRLTVGRITLGGLGAGALPDGLLLFPRRLDGYSSGINWHGTYVDLYINGQPTQYAWLTHLEGCVSWGVYGALTAAVAWSVWQLTAERRGSIDV